MVRLNCRTGLGNTRGLRIDAERRVAAAVGAEPVAEFSGRGPEQGAATSAVEPGGVLIAHS